MSLLFAALNRVEVLYGDTILEGLGVEYVSVCTGEALEDLQAILVIGALAEKYSITVSEDVIDKQISSNLLSDDASVRKCIRFRLLESSVSGYFLQSENN